jgi:hypothetical protein
VLRLKTAKAGHLPPSVMWGTGNPRRWSELDVLLLEGFQLYEDSLCGGCGQPLGHTSELKYTMAFASRRLGDLRGLSAAGQQETRPSRRPV